MKTQGQHIIAYADCFTGVSGDMFLGALIDAGMGLDHLQSELAKLDLESFRMHSIKQHHQGITAMRLEITSDNNETKRTWKDIRILIEKSRLTGPVKEKSLLVFACLAKALAKIHECPAEEVHFHGFGGLEAIIHVVGSVIGLAYFGIADLVASPLAMPSSWVRCDQSVLPLPSPVVFEILKGVRVYGTKVEQEPVTPTGAALIKSLSRDYGDFPAMQIIQTGYGAGRRKLPGEHPNLCRLVIGAAWPIEESQEVEVIETNLDDWSPESYPHLCEQLFDQGALDVSLTPIHMKKGRPGFLLQVICAPEKSWDLKNCIFTGTTSIGLRFRREKRMTLPREAGTVQTPWGRVLVKRAAAPGGYVLYPEYEDCRRLALEKKIPLKDVYAAVHCCPPEKFKEE